MKKLILKHNQIYLNLKEAYYFAYLKAIFGTDDNDAIIVKKTHIIGKFIYSYVRVTHVPKKNPIKTKEGVILVLPTDNVEYYHNKFIYLDFHAERQINSYIDAYFHLQYYSFLIEHAQKFKKRTDLIKAFRDSLTLSEDDISMSTLLKSDLRFRKKIQNTDIENT